MPLPVPIPPSPAASEALLEAFAQRNIRWYPNQVIRELDPINKVARFADGAEMPYDLFLGVPDPPRACGRRRVRHDRRGMDPG